MEEIRKTIVAKQTELASLEEKCLVLKNELDVCSPYSFTIKRVETYYYHNAPHFIIDNKWCKDFRPIALQISCIKRHELNDWKNSAGFIYEINKLGGREDDLSVEKIDNHCYRLIFNEGTEGCGNTYKYSISEANLQEIVSFMVANM